MTGILNFVNFYDSKINFLSQNIENHFFGIFSSTFANFSEFPNFRFLAAHALKAVTGT